MSTKRNRKSLDDALAQQFIYGEKQQKSPEEPAPETTSPPTPPESPSPKISKRTVANTAQKPPNKSRLMEKLTLPPKEATIRFTVDLSESLHQRLSVLAATTGMKKADIVRLLLNDALEDAGF
jgi:hypothetical protein